jgi:serine O-acetyltransferase
VQSSRYHTVVRARSSRSEQNEEPTTGWLARWDGLGLPSKRSVASLTEDLLVLLLPGFFSDYAPAGLPPGKGGDWLALLRQKVEESLKEELARCLRFRAVPGAEATDLTEWFLSQIPEVRQVLETDVEATFQGDPAAQSREEVVLAYPGVEAIAVYRMAHLLYEKGVALLPRMMTEWAHSRTGIDIHPGAEVGTHLCIDHGTGIVIGETCRIGNHVKIYHGVTLGARSTSGGQRLKGQKRHPTIEDYVTIYPGATILGGETVIGAHSIIGGNVWLTHAVDPYSVVTLVQQEIRVRSRAPETSDHWEI